MYIESNIKDINISNNWPHLGIYELCLIIGTHIDVRLTKIKVYQHPNKQDMQEDYHYLSIILSARFTRSWLDFLAWIQVYMVANSTTDK